jgi:hypothetical protein
MKGRLIQSVITIMLIMLSLSYFLTVTTAQKDALTYRLENSSGELDYTLNVVVPSALEEYYQEISHRSSSDSDFPKFVTPYSVEPIANSLRQIYSNDEDFANGVLMFVHQIPYEETIPEFYPIETLQMNKGDCDMFSILAASILKAGGLDVVLLRYPSEEHMNIGVHLSELLKNPSYDIYSVQAKNIVYYIGECTGSNWKIGQCPPDLMDKRVTVITLEESEKISPGQVSASFQKLDLTSLKLNVAPFLSIEGSTVNVEGQILPALPDQNITLYIGSTESQWTVLGNAITEPDGRFSYQWTTEGTCEVQFRASWIGNEMYAGATSETENVLVLPLYIVAFSVTAVIALVICIVLFATTRKNERKQKPDEAIYSYQI